MASGIVDLVIVGAGLHGLIMAKTYHQVHPAASLLVIDESYSLGGTWARERLYPELKTNNVFGSYELSDFPMVAERYGVKGSGHIPGEVVHEYLCDVAEHFGISKFLRLRTRVVGAVMDEEGNWVVSLESTKVNDLKEGQGVPGTETVHAKRLIFATGLTSKPHIPSIPGTETFSGLIIHSKQLKEYAQQLAQSKRVVVVGGNKSAWDVCYTATRNGSLVHMVIRPSGGGPSYLWPRRFSVVGGLFKTSLAKLSTTRFFTLFDPVSVSVPLDVTGPWPLSWIKNMLHKTRLGQTIVRSFWKYLDYLVRKINGYDEHPELKKLEPWTTPFWMGNSLSIHNYETNWFDLVRDGKIRVHIADVASLSKGRVHLRGGEILNADALVLCTGWETDIPVQLNGPKTSDAEAEAGKDKAKRTEAIRTIHESIPYLSYIPHRTPNAPNNNCSATATQPQTKSTNIPLLYHDVVPAQPFLLAKRNLTFIGFSISIHAVIVAQAQALWITAFFADKLPHLCQGNLSADGIRSLAILERVYGEIRRPRETGGLAGRHADLVFDSLPYVDGLLRELGVNAYRKGSWWREVSEAYGAGDYRGLVREWMELQGMGEEDTEHDLNGVKGDAGLD